MELRWLKLALNDVTNAVNYVQEQNPQAAKNLSSTIYKASEQLTEQPLMGRKERFPDTREWVVQKTAYIIVYRVNNDTIDLLRILHTSKKWPKKI